MRLLFVGDGERDAATTLPLVETILGEKVEAETAEWARLHRAGQGYDRKLLWAIQRVRADALAGVVATVDRDRSPGRDRLRSLEAARTKDREVHPPLPTAIGCADPHAEAWLLADAVAVREAMRLEGNHPVPNVRKVADPKRALNDLHAASPRAQDPALQILADIARGLDPGRCSHRAETGFDRFVGEVRREIGPLLRAPSES